MSEFNYTGLDEDDEEDDMQMTSVYEAKENRSKYHDTIDEDEPKRVRKQQPLDEAMNIQFTFGETLTVKKLNNRVSGEGPPKGYNPFKSIPSAGGPSVP